ncbi:MAG: biopolymer transporter ExbD [Pseudomonadota bacterium]
MIRQRLAQRLAEDAETRIDLSPLIDIVFILLIFFIVSTVFVREAGVEIDKPTAASASSVDGNLIIVGVTDQGEVYHAGANIGLGGIPATIKPQLENPADPVVIQADAAVSAQLLVRVIDQLKLAGASNILIATREGE